jgi:hypothetical protein
MQRKIATLFAITVLLVSMFVALNYVQPVKSLEWSNIIDDPNLNGTGSWQDGGTSGTPTAQHNWEISC